MNFNVLSLFSSGGVAETYFEKHGLHVKVASEIMPQRVNIYKHLYPSVKMFEGDITDEENFEAIIDTAKKEKCNFIIATPPCQGMSTVGLQKKDDPRNRLIIDVVNAIKEINPKFVIIENVPGMLNTRIKLDGDWIFIDDFIKSELGEKYNINENKIVNTKDYGVAQSRERCVYLLSEKSTGINWEFPSPLKHTKTMRDVIGDLPSLDPNVTDISPEERLKMFPDYEEKKAKGLSVSKWHFPPRHKHRHVLAMMHTPEGSSAWENEIFYPKLADGRRSKGFRNTYKRQWWDKPAYTVTKYTSRIGSQENGHPGTAICDSEIEEERLWSDARVLTIFELMRVSSLPDDWDIPEGASSNVIREIIGEGVPPKLLEYALIELERLIYEKN